MKTTFSSIVGPTFRSYLALKRALGRQYAMVERVLVHLDQFLTARSADLSAETFAAWCLTFQHLASGNRRNRMREVRNVCLYRRRREPSCFVPDERLFPPVHQPIRPHIFTDGEVGQLLAAARTRAHTDNSPLCPETMRLAIVLLYTTGMRRRELTRLTVGDYNPREHTLMIRESKFHKSRLIPVSGDAGREIDRLLETRRQQQYPTGGIAIAAIAAAASAPPCARSSVTLRSARRLASCRARMIFDMPLPLPCCFGGTTLAWTCKRSCRSWRTTWGTSRSSRLRTTCSLSSRSPRRRVRASQMPVAP